MVEFKNTAYLAPEFNAGDPAPFHEGIHKDGAERCVVCGRKVGKKSYLVEVIDGGDIREQDGTEADTEDAGYMGCWPVGSECAKKFAPNILFVRQGHSHHEWEK